MEGKLYCIILKRELEDQEVLHKRFDYTPTRDEIISFIRSEGFLYDDKFDSFDYYEVEE